MVRVIGSAPSVLGRAVAQGGVWQSIHKSTTCGWQSTSRPVTAMHWVMPLAPIDRVVHARATIMTDRDIFWLLGVLALCLRPLALFLPQMPRRAVPAH